MTRILLVVALAACGGGTHATPPPSRPAPPDAAPDSAPVAVAKPLTTAECEQLMKHILEIEVNSRPKDQQLSAEEQKNIDLRPGVEMCEQHMKREAFDCAMRANTTPALADCDQRTPSSSTSKSSVAPPGITPPAPR